MTNTLTYRVVGPGDSNILRSFFLFARPELAMLPPSLVDMQMRAQETGYSAAYSKLVKELINLDGDPVGYIWVDHGEIVTLVDICVDPLHRGKGIGTAAIERLIALGKEVRLSVVKDNPARRLYERMGFVEESTDGIRIHMSRIVCGP